MAKKQKIITINSLVYNVIKLIETKQQRYKTVSLTKVREFANYYGTSVKQSRKPTNTTLFKALLATLKNDDGYGNNLHVLFNSINQFKTDDK